MDIPHIKFHPPGTSESLIEIIDLDGLYKRRDTLYHDPEKPHRIGFNALIYIEEGEGSHFLDFTQRAYGGGSFIFVRKNQVNAFDLSNRPQGKAILFMDEFISRIQESMEMPVFSPIYLADNYSPVFKPSESLQKSSKNLLLEIGKELQHETPDSLVVMFLFSSLFLIIERERGESNNQTLGKDKNKKFGRFIELLEQQFTQTRNASDYADQLHITYKTLNQLCKQATGQSAKQLIDAYTILEAKRRLVLEKKPVQQLADELGFDEVTNFVKYFKKHTLLTPSEFHK